jgi:hypothetical protein
MPVGCEGKTSGVVVIGEVPDYIVRGVSEILMRKTTGPVVV